MKALYGLFLVALLGCAEGGPAAECITNGDCPQGYCAGGACVDQACSDDFDCPLGSLCLDGRCDEIQDRGDAGGQSRDLGSDPGRDTAVDTGMDQGGEEDTPRADASDAAQDQGVDTPDVPDVMDPPDAMPDAPDGVDAPDGTEDMGPDLPQDMGGPECVVDIDCLAAQWCDAGACVPGCHRDDGCLESEVCDLDTHTCVERGCIEDEDCEGDLVCNRRTGECELPVDPETCGSNADCPPGEVCSLQSVGDDLVPACIAVVGDGVHGSPCAEDADCRSGWCQGETVRRCIGLCADNGDCGPGNTSCQQVPFALDEQRTVTHSVCDWAQGSGLSCTSDASCPGQEVCTLDLAVDEVNLRCRPAWGERGPGGQCAVSNDCQTGLCGSGECFGACASDGDCEDDTACLSIRLLEDSDPVLVCTAPPSACGSDLDCEEGTLCQPYVDELRNQLVPYCLPALNEGGSLAGQRCFDNDDCASGFCLATRRQGLSVCYGVCEVPNLGCNGGTRCYPDEISYTFDQGTPGTLDDRYHSTPACQPDFGSYQDCQADAQCPNGEICMPTANSTRDDWVLRCIDPINPNGARAGTTCAEAADCASATCLPDFLVNVCFGTCRTAADCPNGQSCQEVYNFRVNDRGTPNNELDDIAVAVRQCTNF